MTAQKDFVDGRVVDGRVTIDVFRYGQTLPLHPGVEHPQDEMKDAMIAQFALWTALGHREVREDKCGELGFGELDRDGRGCWLLCRGAHHTRASCEAIPSPIWIFDYFCQKCDFKNLIKSMS